MKAFRLLAIGLCIVLSVTNVSSEVDEDDTLLRAMHDEMDRALSELQLEDEPKPYFISYTVEETTTASESYVLGAQDGSIYDQVRRLTTKVRVGSKSLDNSNFVNLQSDPTAGANSGSLLLPIDDNYHELRRSLWIATDQAYKEAIAAYAAKKAAVSAQSRRSRSADFSDEVPFSFKSSNEVPQPSTEAISSIARELSKTFQGHSEIFGSSATVVSVATKRTYLDSEGNYHTYTTEFCSAKSRAETHSTEGTELSDTTTFLAKGCGELPDVSTMKQQTAQMVDQLKRQRHAEELAAYDGPVLLEAQAVAEFANQVLLDLFGAVPLPQIGNADFDARIQQLTTPFLDRMNARVFPRSFNIVNDPTITEYEGRPLLGSYSVDAEGLPSRRTELVVEGRLRRLLTSRAPIGSLENSTGSHRGLPLPLPGNLFLTMDSAVTMDELKSQLLATAESNGSDFAVFIRKISNALDIHSDHAILQQKFHASMSGAILVLPSVYATKVYSDGRETPLQPVVIVNFDPSFFKDILGVSETRQHFDVPVSTLGPVMVSSVLTRGVGSLAGADQTIASVVTPALLFEELSLRSARDQNPKLPIVPHPLSNN
ncbi:MAG: metallopeptidase TldD-related protein [Gammaproteobacteria bacterium]|nr:metallopeptidase TldD-related protein [Gammaproteobacteria bacterium]